MKPRKDVSKQKNLHRQLRKWGKTIILIITTNGGTRRPHLCSFALTNHSICSCERKNRQHITYYVNVPLFSRTRITWKPLFEVHKLNTMETKPKQVEYYEKNCEVINRTKEECIESTKHSDPWEDQIQNPQNSFSSVQVLLWMCEVLHSLGKIRIPFEFPSFQTVSIGLDHLKQLKLALLLSY